VANTTYPVEEVVAPEGKIASLHRSLMGAMSSD